MPDNRPRLDPAQIRAIISAAQHQEQLKKKLDEVYESSNLAEIKELLRQLLGKPKTKTAKP